MKIDRCICYNRSFQDIYKESLEKNINTLQGIQKIMNICNKCKLCNPYIEESLTSGKTDFNNIIKN
jgi:hypothetical protein